MSVCFLFFFQSATSVQWPCLVWSVWWWSWGPWYSTGTEIGVRSSQETIGLLSLWLATTPESTLPLAKHYLGSAPALVVTLGGKVVEKVDEWSYWKWAFPSLPFVLCASGVTWGDCTRAKSTTSTTVRRAFVHLNRVFCVGWAWLDTKLQSSVWVQLQKKKQQHVTISSVTITWWNNDVITGPKTSWIELKTPKHALPNSFADTY